MIRVLKSRINIFFIRIKIFLLKKEREREYFRLMKSYPKACEKSDSVESIKPELFNKIDSDIKKYRRVINLIKH